MKLLYALSSWSWCGVTDMLMPVVKLQIKECKLVMGVSISGVAAQIARSAPDQTPTIRNLCVTMLKMHAKEFEAAGGWWAILSPGDAFWVPPACVVGEFNLGDMEGSEVASQTLSWVGLTQYHCSSETQRS